MSDLVTSPSRGRPRSEASRSAIIAAASQLLRTVGLQRMTVEAVAERSGVGKATIYRWWSSKGMLALDAYLEDMRSKVVPPDTGDGREDFRQHTLAVLNFYGGEDGKVFAQFMAEGQSDPQLGEAFRQRFLVHRRATVRAIWQRGVERGDFRDDIDVDVAIDMLFGPIIYRLLAGHQPLTKSFAKALTEAALNGLCKCPERALTSGPSR
jgi:AcrR family transcriptional regulator